MIFRKIELVNFGIYGGRRLFNLAPQPKDGFNRPIILFKGKNGAGKTTLTEAIRLCLHGSLALGNRVSRTDYEDHLAARLHRSSTDQQAPFAGISLVLDYVEAGHRCIYTIRRSWKQKQDRIKETIKIFDGEAEITDFSSNAQKESFLRELVPPRVADIFFFDGEKLENLVSDEAAAALLKDTVETLFGLNLVNRLQKDLDIYLTRQKVEGNAQSLQQQLKALKQEQYELEQKLTDLELEKERNEDRIARLTQLWIEQKQKIAGEGGWFAERLDESQARGERLEGEIEILRKQAQELANGLLPFAISAQMNRLVAQRLHLEYEYEQAVSAQKVLDRKFEQVAAEMADSDYWADLDLELDETARRKLLAKLEATIRQTAQPPDIDSTEILFRVSDQDRQTLLAWIERAADEIPRQFCRTIHHLNLLEEELAEIKNELELVPANETLQPLVATLYEYSREQGTLEKRNELLEEEKQRLHYQLEQNQGQLRRIKEQLVEQEQHNRRIHLAIKSYKVLEEYTRRLRVEKIKLLERELVRRFNQLCRKEDLISAAKIETKTFKITLMRRGQSLARKQLSAGEKQLLATATMWALRDVSNAPMPIVLDTPLGRLDSDHRLSMLDYFPQAGHQVILLATDTEIDTALENNLRPAISWSYDLDRLNHPSFSGEIPGPYGANGRSYLQLTLINDEATAYETE